MRVELKGLHTTRKKLADGTVKRYYYAWRGGPAIDAQPNTPDFIEQYRKAWATRKAPDTELMHSLIARFKQQELPKKSDATRRDYTRYIKMIEDRFGEMPIAGIEELGSRAVFEDWRDEMKDNPRKADLAWTVLQRIFSVAVKSEKLKRNPCVGGGRLSGGGTRKDIIWTEDAIGKFKASAPEHIRDVFMVALWTGQRQGDILNLTWSSYDGRHIRLKQSKTKRNVTVKVAKELKAILDRRRPAEIGPGIDDKPILTTLDGSKWTSDGFRASWGKALAKAKIPGLTFHDLRGTFVTLARRSGSSIDDIAEATGHSTSDVRSILESHYLASDNKASDGVILKLERKNGERNGKPSANRSKPVVKV